MVSKIVWYKGLTIVHPTLPPSPPDWSNSLSRSKPDEGEMKQDYGLLLRQIEWGKEN